ncbi:MAG: type IV pilus assembly protein PilM [Candidatus Coatesbacteria bacterium]|nr:type IV pilus assembly protein PilM [Candidatus Coatesbacteria bacterium]
MFFKSKKQQVIGLDIGSGLIKVVVLEHAKDSISLVNYKMISLLPDAIVDGEIMDRLAVVDTIRDLIQQSSIKTKDVVTAVSGRAVIIKRIKVDKCTPEELAESIRFEAESYVPYQIDEVNVDFQILDDTEEGAQMDVLLVAAKKDHVNNYTSLIKEAGLNPRRVDVDSFAIQNAYEHNYSIDLDKTIAFLNIGSSVTNVNIMRGGFPYFTRDVTFAGNTIISALQKNIGLSYDDASAILKGEEKPGIDNEAVESVVSTIAKDLALEINRSFAALKSVGADISKIDLLILSGGCAKSPGLKSYFENNLNVQVEVLNPIKRVNISSKPDIAEDAHIYTLALGLALVAP